MNYTDTPFYTQLLTLPYARGSQYSQYENHSQSDLEGVCHQRSSAKRVAS